VEVIGQDADGDGQERGVPLNLSVGSAQSFDLLDKGRARSISQGHGEKIGAPGGFAAAAGNNRGQTPISPIIAYY
jgi:hypothetical protein